MTRLKAIIESTPELIGGKAATPVVETASAVAEREALAISQAKENIQRVIESLEHNFGVVPAFQITRHLCAALDAMGTVKR